MPVSAPHSTQAITPNPNPNPIQVRAAAERAAAAAEREKANAARDEIIRRMEAERDAREAAELAEMKARAEARERQEQLPEALQITGGILAVLMRGNQQIAADAHLQVSKATLTLALTPRPQPWP